MKNYPPEFKADAVALYESRPEAGVTAEERADIEGLRFNPGIREGFGRR